jgi:signal transduction histidine kinase
MGKDSSRHISIRATLLLIIGVFVLLAGLLGSRQVYVSWWKLERIRSLVERSDVSNLLYKAEKYLSLERGNSLPLIFASAGTARNLADDIGKNRAKGAQALDEALEAIGRNPATPELSARLSDVQKSLQALQALRGQLDSAAALPAEARDPALADRFFDASTRLIWDIRNLSFAYMRPLQSIDAEVSRQMQFKYAVWEITEYAGREYAVLGKLIAEGKPVTPDVQEKLTEWRALINQGWETASRYAAGSRIERKIGPFIKEAQTHYFLTFGQIKDIFYVPPAGADADSDAGVSYPVSIEMWLVLSAEAVDSLLVLKDAAIAGTQDYIVGIEYAAQRNIALSLILFLCAVALSVYCLFVIEWRVARPVNQMVDALYKTSLGMPHDPIPAVYRHDEIGKLAAVLAAFEENIRTLKQSNEELERYAYITAHDLKSPLRAIDNLSKWIEEDIGDKLEGETREHMATLRQRVRRMEKLLNDTLEYSRSGRMIQEDNEIMNGKALVEDAVSLAAPPEGFTVNVNPAFMMVEAHRLPLQQVFYNLINNAIKHHDREDGRIDVSVREQDRNYLFSVADDGPGIAKQYHAKIFDMFQTLKPRDETEGSGMGLAIVKKILTTYGGTITVESDTGKGTVFYFTWPKVQQEKNNERERHG